MNEVSSWHSNMIKVSEIAEGRGIHVYVAGDTTVAALYREKSELVRRFPNLANWCFAIVDLTDVGRMDADFAGIQTLVGQDIRLGKLFRIGFLVVIVAPAELPFGISRMWQGVSDGTGWKNEIVRDRISAERWIQRNVLADFGIELPPLTLQPPATGTGG